MTLRKLVFKIKFIKNNKDDFLFDDCPICQAMKKAQEQGRKLKAAEFKDFFEKAKDSNAVVVEK